MRHNIIDAQAAMGFILSQTSHIEAGVYNIKYPDIQYPMLIPVDTSGHPFAQTVTYFSADKAGAAEWINGNADDIPKADIDYAKHETTVHMAGIGYGYGFEEIEQARMLGRNLTGDKAGASRRASEEFIDRVALEGDTVKGYSGLFDHPDVTANGAEFGDWLNADPVQILTDFNNAITNIHTQTNTVSMANTVLMPFTRFLYLASTPRSEMSDTTILEYLKKYNAYTAATGQPLTIRGVRKLDTAGVSGSARMVTYRRDPEVLKLHLPMPHRFLPPWQSGALRIDVPGIFRLGGLDIRLPKEVGYTDDI